MNVGPLYSKALCVGVVFALLVSGMSGVVAADSQPTEIDSCTTIRSAGDYALTTDIENSNAGSCISITASDVTFDGGGHTVDGVGGDGNGIAVRGSGAVSNVTVTDVIVTDWRVGIFYRGATDGRITSVTADGNFVTGIDLQSTTDTAVRDATVARNGIEFGVQFRGEGLRIQDGSGNTVRGVVSEENNLDGIRLISSSDNTIRNFVARQNGRHGLHIDERSNDNTVRNSRFRSNDRDGMTIRADSTGNALIGNVARNNGLDSNDGDGVEVLKSDESLVKDNVLENHPDDGITIDNDSKRNRVVGNVVRDNGVNGILIRVDADDNQIVGNRLSGNSNGIQIESETEGVDTTGVTVSDNLVVDSDRYGILLRGGSDHEVVLNTVRGSGDVGVLLSGTTETTVAENEVAGYPSLAFENGDDNTVHSNRFLESIVVDDESRSNLIYNNDITVTDDSGVVFTGTPRSNTWNVSERPGENIVGGGTIGGNYYYEEGTGSGFSQTCEDTDSDGICDSPNQLGPNNVDYLPLADPTGPPPVVDGRSPTDPDGDGRYEDVDGSGEVTYADVVVLFEYLNDPAVQNFESAYDFDGNGEVTYNDVVALFQET